MQFFKVAAIIGLFWSGQAAAQDVRTASFKIGSVAMTAKLPKGYCEPSGAGIANAQRTALADPGNATTLTLYPCSDVAGVSGDYYLVKTPRSLLNTPMTREEILKAITAELEDPNFSAEKLSSDTDTSTSASVSGALGTQVQVKTDIRPLGRDADCAYMGGVVVMTAGAGQASVNVGGCITAAGGRAIMVFRYRSGSNMADAAKLLPDAKALALAVSARR